MRFATILKERSMSKIDQARLNLIDRYWKAANYLTVGQIYLQDNPLLKEPLRPEQSTAIMGTLGTSPGLSFIYLHFEPVIKDHNVNMIYLADQATADLPSSQWLQPEGTAKERLSRIGNLRHNISVVVPSR